MRIAPFSIKVEGQTNPACETSDRSPIETFFIFEVMMPTSKTWPSGGTNATPTSYSIPATGELNWQALSSFLTALADSAQATTFQKFAVRVATTSPVTVSATSDCVIVTDLSVAGPVTVNLPAGATKQVFAVVDGKGDAATNNITIDGNGSETINGSLTYVIDNNQGGVILIFNGTEWKVLAETAGTAALTNPMTGTGDMIYGGASGVPTRLAAGTLGQLLVAAGASAPTWTNSISNSTLVLTDTTSSGTTDFRIQSNNTTGTSKLSIGTGSDPDAGYMQYNVASGSISWGTNGGTDTLQLLSATNTRFLMPDGAVGLPGWSFVSDPDTGVYRIGANQIGVATAGTRRLTIDSNGVLFANGSSSLNYYDEGSWTPSSTFSGGNGTRTDDVATGRYTRIGRQVFVQWRLELTKGTASGNFTITGLPFTIGAIEAAGVVGVPANIALTSTQQLVLIGGASGTSIEVAYMENAGSRTQVTAANLGATAVLYGTMVYTV